MALTQVDQGLLGTYAQYTGFKNRILNGSMMIDQRNAGASVANIVGYGVDRWYGSYLGGGTGRFSAQQSTTAPTGFKNSWLITVTTTDASPAAGYGYAINQPIEGFNCADLAFGTANAAAVTISFWVRSSVTGTFPAFLINATPTRAYGATYTINSANTWEYKTITIAGDTTGTWATDNSAGITVQFGFGGGSSRTISTGWQTVSNYSSNVTGCTNLMATNGATFYITGVQLEKGSTATSFDYRPYGTELALCQRYYQTSTVFVSGSADTYYGVWAFKVSMRAAPTIAGGAAGFVTAATANTEMWIGYQTTRNFQTLTASIEL